MRMRPPFHVDEALGAGSPARRRARPADDHEGRPGQRPRHERPAPDRREDGRGRAGMPHRQDEPVARGLERALSVEAGERQRVDAATAPTAARTAISAAHRATAAGSRAVVHHHRAGRASCACQASRKAGGEGGAGRRIPPDVPEIRGPRGDGLAPARRARRRRRAPTSPGPTVSGATARASSGSPSRARSPKARTRRRKARSRSGGRAGSATAGRAERRRRETPARARERDRRAGPRPVIPSSP